MYDVTKFNDGQIASKITTEGNLEVKLRGNTYEDLFKAASIKEAWDATVTPDRSATANLTLYCLIGQRSDRRFNVRESFDLKVIARFINSMNFNQVSILHPHSSVSLALIENSVEISHLNYVKMAYESLNKPVLVSPDAGAFKATYTIAKELGADLVPSNKVRINNEPLITLQGDVKGKECLIVDDLADGGRTFLNLAKALNKQGAVKVFLYVTHGQFNHGFDELLTIIDHIYCTNSYREIEEDRVTQFMVFE